MRKLLVASALLLSATSAWAGTAPLDTFNGPAFSVGLPRGWNVTSDPSRGVIIAQEDPNRQDAAALLLLTVNGTDQSAEALLDAVAGQFATGLKVARRETVPGGGMLMVADGRIGDITVRLGVIAVAQNGTAVVCLVGAKPRQFVDLGGIDLVVAVMASMQANAQPQAPAPAPAPGANPAPSDDPNYIPPPARPLRVADVVGEWKKGESSSITTYVNSYTGNYAGFNSISTTESWSINAKGQCKGDFYGITAGNGGPHAVKEKYNATIAFSPDGVIFGIKKDADANTTKFIVRGWAERPNGTVLILNGPFYNDVPQDCLNPQKCVNLNNTWVRPRTPPK